MSDEIVATDNGSSEESKLNGDEVSSASADPVGETSSKASSQNTEASVDETPDKELENEPPKETEEVHHRKRRASSAFSDDEDFKGFDLSNLDDSTAEYSQILERMEAEVSAASENFKPLRNVTATSGVGRVKRLRQDTGDGSRPSSPSSTRSDGDLASSTDPASGASSPLGRGRRVAGSEMSSPLLRVPLERGWRREMVYRAALDARSRRQADIYYYTPQGKKLRSSREVSEHLSGTGLTLENFSFFKEALGVDDPDKEIIRDAKFMRRDSPIVPAPAPVSAEGKRVPKPKPPKGASPEPAPLKTPPAKIKVKSAGSRLNNSMTASTPTQKTTPAQTKKQQTTGPSTNTDNNNSTAWKKPSETKAKGRLSNGAATATVASPRRRGRPRNDDTDYFTEFYNKNKGRNHYVIIQIFQYLGMRDLARCARVCKLWRELASTPVLWRHVRMKNSHVSDWGGLCAALKRHGTKRLDLRKMLLPQNDKAFWDAFAEHIHTVDTLERLELCRCPAAAVEAACRALPGLVALSAGAVRDSRLDPAPLALLPKLRELRLKSLAGLSLTGPLDPLASLTNLQHLSLTSIKELGRWSCEVVARLPQLVSLELGECTFGASMGTALRGLSRLARLRLERGPADAAAPALLRALARLPNLAHLELVNVDVKAGFDEALGECTNIQRLLIIPTYVSQSATTNKQVLSGVLRLKESLTHLVWGVTIELLRVTELFIDQCKQGEAAEGGDAAEAGSAGKRRDIGECIPVLKPVPGCRLPSARQPALGPPQVEILPLPTLQRLLSAQLPRTKLKLLRIPFHATWRQSLADFT